MVLRVGVRLAEAASLKGQLRTLAEQATLKVAESNFTLESFRDATALHDLERDSMVTALPAFEEARAGVGALLIVQERYGPVWERFPLQFVYRFLGTLSEPIFDLGVFETTWEAFWEELSEPEWTWLGLANLRNFRTDTYDPLDLGHDTTIRGRGWDELLTLGCSRSYVDQLFLEWHEGGFGSHVLLTEHTEPKTPDNFQGNNLKHDLKALNAIRALRLLGDGDVGIGRIWISRRVSFDLGNQREGVLSHMGSRSPASTSLYTLDPCELAPVRDLYDTLLQFEGMRDRAPVNLDLALQSFSDMYERHSFRADTRLIDAVTALEALLGTRHELTFRLTFRIAVILGSNHDHRLEIFKQMKDAYQLRSDVVHGSRLTPKQRAKLQNQQPVRNVVRQLLSGFIRLTTTPGHPFNRQFFKDNLDISLVDDITRSKLRVAMGLEENNSNR